MKIQIKDSTDLMTQLDMVGLKIGESIQSLCVSLFDQGQALGEKTVLIQISTELVSGSYVGNPAQFARTMLGKCPYPVLQSFMADGYINIRAGKKKRPTTFRALVRETLEEAGTYTVSRQRIPASYRRRPSILSGVLTRELDQDVCNESKGKENIRWYLKD